MIKSYKKILLFIGLILCTFSICSYAEGGRNVYIIPIKGEINPAVTEFVKGAIKEAENDSEAVAIIFEIDTLGGMIHQATEIRDAIMKTKLDTISFVNNKAESAGVLLTISSKNIVMSKGSTIGSAETIPYTEKNISYWKGELRTTAEQRGRDVKLIEAMADKRMEIKDKKDGKSYIVKKGELLNLTTKEAEKLGFTDLVADSHEEILSFFHIAYENIIEVDPSLKVKIAQSVTSGVLLPIILSIGFIGLVVEILTPGFGVGGTISLLAFTVFFGGSMLAGNAGMAVIFVFIIGIILLVVEAIIPGFGAPGIGGIICIVVSIVLSSESVILGVTSLGIAFLLTIVVAALLIKYGPKNKYLDKVILGTELRKDEGFIPTKEKEDLLGVEGITLTPLRPSGAIEVNDERLDVVTDGQFVEIGTYVKIIKVEGSKIVVKKIN